MTYITFIGILFKLFADLALEKFCKEFNPFSEVRACIMFKDPEGVFKGIIGTYEKVKGAPAYIAFIGDMTSPFVHEKLGYTGEAIILEAISLELSTYWVGGFFRPEVVAEVIKLHNTEGVLAVVLVGYADKKIYSGRKDTGRISQWS